MASNSFGEIFRITTFGESHGKAMGVVIDGCPAGLSLSGDELEAGLALRSTNRSKYVSPRNEKDKVTILSGIFENKTTGAPLSIIIDNEGADSSKYSAIKNILRPGHANYTYFKKYHYFDYRGGGRASARETVCRVVSGVIAKKILAKHNIQIASYLKSVGNICANIEIDAITELNEKTYRNAIFCPSEKDASLMMQEIEKIKLEGDSIGGVVEFIIENLPVGLGNPIYNKLDAVLASAMMSIPATKGFEIGEGFNATKMKGSEHNDLFISHRENASAGVKITTKTNHAGGTLGGIATGMPLIGRVAFKPTSSIMQTQKTVHIDGKDAILQLPPGSKHDPCVAIRAVPVVEAMAAIVIADLLQK